MNTSIKNLASIIAAAIWADGVYDESEKVTVEEIAEALELDVDAFKADVDTEIAAVADMNEDQANAYLQEAAAGVDDEEVAIVYECAMQIVSCDGVLAREEVANLLALADALCIDTADAVLLIVDMVKSEPELEIDVEE